MSSNKEREKETAKTVGILALFVGAGYGIYRLFSRKPAPCTPGTTKCEGYNLYTCNTDGEWVLTESNSPQCGYVPEQWFGERQELGRGSFAIAVVTGGWVTDNMEMGEKDFALTVIDSGWRADNVELGRGSFSIHV